MTLIFFGGLGLIIGSFLNVVILREGTGKTILGRSHCGSCGTQLVSYDLVPVFSWFALRGRCRYCGSRVSFQYPLVEATTGALFVAIGLSPLGPIEMAFALVVASLFVAITVYDLRHTIIPDAWSYYAAGAALVYAFLAVSSPEEAIMVLSAGPIAALPLAGLWAVSGGRWMGLGDAKLALSIGWLLGPVIGLSAILFAFVLGAAASVFILLPLSHVGEIARAIGITSLSPAQRRFTMKSEVPFGPFLVASCIILWFAQLYSIAIPLLP